MKKNIIKVMKENNGIMTTSEIENYGYSRTNISDFVDQGLLVRENRGIYVTQNSIEDEMYMFQLKNSKAIYCNNSALYLWNETEKTPDKYDVAVPINYNPHRIKDIVNVYREKDEIYELGIVEKNTPIGMKVKTYNLEKTICDIINNEDCIDLETKNKAIREIFKRDDFDLDKMYNYAKIMKIYEKVSKYVEVLL